MDKNVKLASFYLWQYSGCESTLALWYCAEDMASFFARREIFTEGDLLKILELEPRDKEYIAFARHISYRLHLYTGIKDEDFNWHMAEWLLKNAEWRGAIISMAADRASNK